MICTIHQPNFLPYPGFFDKAARSDVFILYDTAQFVKNGWQNRNRICTKDGWNWLTLPVEHEFGQNICEVRIFDPVRSLKKNWNTIKSVYGNSPYFKNYSFVFEKYFSDNFILLSEFNCTLIKEIAKIIGLKTMFIKSSELPIISSKGTEALIELCKLVNADVYISGKSGKNYINENIIRDTKIKLMYQDYKYPIYEQFNNQNFQPNMSIIDFIFNCGSEYINIITKK